MSEQINCRQCNDRQLAVDGLRRSKGSGRCKVEEGCRWRGSQSQWHNGIKATTTKKVKTSDGKSRAASKTRARYWTWIHHVAIWGECFIWFMFLLLSGELPHGKMIELHKLFISVLAPTCSFYIIVIMGTVIALLPSFAAMSVFRNFFPEDYQIIQEIERNDQRHVSTCTRKTSSELGLELTQPGVNGSAASLGFKYAHSSGIFDSRHAIESEVESSREFDSKDLTDTRQLYGNHKSRSTPIENIHRRHDDSLSIASFRMIKTRSSSLCRRIFSSR